MGEDGWASSVGRHMLQEQIHGAAGSTPRRKKTQAKNKATVLPLIGGHGTESPRVGRWESDHTVALRLCLCTSLMHGLEFL